MNEAEPPPGGSGTSDADTSGSPLQGPEMPGHLPGMPGHPRSPVWYGLMNKAEHAALLGAQGAAHLPVWRRKTRGEHRWPVSLSVIVAIVLQLRLPDQLTLRPLPTYLLPVLEGAMLVGLAIANPVRIERRGTFVRWASLVLIILITFANAASAVLLIHEILTGRAGGSAGPLLASGAAIWATNVIAFGLWYWEFDTGGPVHRAYGTLEFPDFLFPQMTDEKLHPRDWKPQFVDYLYLSFTNATAFSPTDVMPLARWAKLTMLLQSAVSLSLGALVIARAVNILPG